MSQQKKMTKWLCSSPSLPCSLLGLFRSGIGYYAQASLPVHRVFSLFCSFICVSLHTSTSTHGAHIDTCLHLPFLPFAEGWGIPVVFIRIIQWASIRENGHLLDPPSQVDVLDMNFGVGIIVLILETREFNLPKNGELINSGNKVVTVWLSPTPMSIVS